MEGHSSDSSNMPNLSKHKRDLEKVAHVEIAESDEQKSIQKVCSPEEPWAVENDDNYIEIDGLSPSKMSVEENNKERTILVARKKHRSFNFFPGNIGKKARELLNSPIAIKQKYPSNDDDIETFIKSKLSKISLGPSCSTDTPGSSCSMDLPGPSCSTNTPSILTHLQGASSSLKPHTSSSANVNFYSSNSNIDHELINNFYNKIHLGEANEQIPKYSFETRENAEASPLEVCSFAQGIPKIRGLEDNDEDIESDSSESFVEDPDVVNPDILYNIDLNEYYKYMEELVKKIREAPDNPYMLDKCINLKPIPQVEHEPLKFTAEERLNFINGISEWEYDIESENWNNIMVKRAVIFTTHAGFSIANEESLYVLADVATDYTKKLAIIMKKHFDVQSTSSCPESIDPINNSLQEIGVLDGIRELLKHYENDIFGRRDRLTKKCHHLKKVIDAYVKRLLPSHKITNQLIAEKNLKTVGNKTKIKSTAGNATTDSLNYADLVHTKVDSVQENTEANETNLSVTGIEKTETIDLLKPLITDLNTDVEHTICNVEERYLKVKCLESRDPNLLNPFECSKSKKILVKQESSPASSSDNDDDNKKLMIPLENEEIDKNTLKFCRMLEDFGDIENVKIKKIKPEDSVAVPVPDKTVPVHDPTDHDEGRLLTKDNTDHSVSMVDENSNDDVVYVDTFFTKDDSKKND